MKIRIYTDVETVREIEQYGLPSGSVGTVVDIHAHGKAYEVEFDELVNGMSTATLTEEEIRPIQEM